jgi:hypothetical protein
MNIGPSVEQKRDCLKASSDSSPRDRRFLIFFFTPLCPCPSLEQKGCLGPVSVTARLSQLLVQVRHPLLPASSFLSPPFPCTRPRQEESAGLSRKRASSARRVRLLLRSKTSPVGSRLGRLW